MKHRKGCRRSPKYGPLPQPLLPTGYGIAKLQQVQDCRLIRELDSPVFTTLFRHQEIPLELLSWPNCGVSETVYFTTRKDNGHVYYSAKSLRESDSARALLDSSETKEISFSRLPLLLAPSIFAEWPCSGVDLKIVDDVKAGIQLGLPAEHPDFDTDLTDGFCEIGPIACERLRIPLLTDPNGRFCNPVVFRSVLPNESSDFFLAKGVLFLNKSLGNEIRMRRSCIKMEFLRSCKVRQPGFDIVVSFSTKGPEGIEPKSPGVMGRPDITPQLAVALQQRCCLMGNREEEGAELLSKQNQCWILLHVSNVF